MLLERLALQQDEISISAGQIRCKFVLVSIAMICTIVQSNARVFSQSQNAIMEPLRAAKQAVKWIRSTAIQSSGRLIWPAIPSDPASGGPSLYAGTAGVVLFFLEAYHATGDESFLVDASSGADYLLDSIEEEKQLGLYEGLAGTGFVLRETFKATKNEVYQKGFSRCIEILKERSRQAGAGVEWSDTTDIIAGSAGIGLFLLYANRETNDDACKELASAAGLRLIELGQEEKGGLKWAMDPRFERLMPNFSHGTAGIAYFLATLYVDTKDQRFLDAALAGANYLKAIANSDGGGSLIFHHEPASEELYYLGWCHGPAGTARLYYRLYQATGDDLWKVLMERAADSIIRSGIPHKQIAGFWNNVGQCCGSAGVAEFFLDLNRVTNDKRYVQFAEVLTKNLLERATDDEQGMRWVQAEHRVQPDLLHAQTGYMQGAAGIGIWLLHWDEFRQGKPRRIVLPDSPF